MASSMASKALDNTNPLKVIGVVGGGQLAQMLVLAGKEKEVDVIVQTGSVSDPAAKKSTNHIIREPTDFEGTKELASKCNSITFENEWINVREFIDLENNGIKFIPSLSSLEPLVDKLLQRNLLKKLNIAGPDFIALNSNRFSYTKLPEDWQFPIMAKASRGGYDGKGTRVIHSFSELEKLFNQVNKDIWFIEKWIKYEKELAIVASRDFEGQVRVFPLVETFQSNQVCEWVLVPSNVSHQVEAMARNIATSLLTNIDYVGVIAIEFFFGSNGLMVNEIAPRTHNSAHYSIEACNTSQFDQQLCIASHLPLSDPKLLSPGAIMINLLGLPESSNLSLEKRISDINNIEGASLHWYEKELESPGRKVGHVTFLLKEQKNEDRLVEAKSILKKIRSIWPLYSAN